MLTSYIRPVIGCDAELLSRARPSAGPKRLACRWTGALLAMSCAAALPLAAAAPASADVVRHKQQWVLTALDVPAAWHVTQGRGVLVAVIDSGVDPAVSDLAGSVTMGPDLTGVGTPMRDPNWGDHGTWMASLIAGHGHGRGGQNGVLGVAPKSRILSIRVITDRSDPGYRTYLAESEMRGQRELARAIKFAVSRHAGVISMSLGYDAPSLIVRAALQYALVHNVVVVASSGNSGTSQTAAGQGIAPYSFPADYPGVIGVAALSQSGQPAYFSSQNLSVQVAAPGVNVPAQGRGSKYWVVSGTSPACALTAGVAALVKSRYPQLTAAQIRRAITTSSVHRPPGGYNDEVGFGMVDAAAALRTAGRLARQAPAGQSAAAIAAASGYFGNGEAGVPVVPVPPRGKEKLYLLLAIAAVGFLLTCTSMWRFAIGVAGRKAAGPTGDPGLVPFDGAAVNVLYPPQAQPPPGQPFAGQPFPGQPVPGQPVPGQPVPGQPFPGQPVPGQPFPGQPVPGQPFPSQPHRPGSLGQAPPSPGFPGQGLPGQPGPGHLGPTLPVQPGQGYVGAGYSGPAYSAQPSQTHPGQSGQAPASQPGLALPGQSGQALASQGFPSHPVPGFPGRSQRGPGHQGQPGQDFLGQAQPGLPGQASDSQSGQGYPAVGNDPRSSDLAGPDLLGQRRPDLGLPRSLQAPFDDQAGREPPRLGQQDRGESRSFSAQSEPGQGHALPGQHSWERHFGPERSPYAHPGPDVLGRQEATRPQAPWSESAALPAPSVPASPAAPARPSSGQDYRSWAVTAHTASDEDDWLFARDPATPSVTPAVGWEGSRSGQPATVRREDPATQTPADPLADPLSAPSSITPAQSAAIWGIGRLPEPPSASPAPAPDSSAVAKAEETSQPPAQAPPSPQPSSHARPPSHPQSSSSHAQPSPQAPRSGATEMPEAASGRGTSPDRHDPHDDGT